MHSPLGTGVFTFSPDSRLLLCCGLSTDSLTNFLINWDVQTGVMVAVRESRAQAKGRPSAITLTHDGIVGVAYVDRSTPEEFTICIYEIGSGQCIYSHTFDEWFAGIWTHGQSLRFSSIQPGTITVWEVALAPGYDMREVKSLHAPSNFNPFKPFFFFPVLYRLSYVAEDAVLISDTQNGKLLLEARDGSLQESMMSFSPDGQFFACGTAGPDIYLWKEFPIGYKLHRKLTSSTLSPTRSSRQTWHPS